MSLLALTLTIATAPFTWFWFGAGVVAGVIISYVVLVVYTIHHL